MKPLPPDAPAGAVTAPARRPRKAGRAALAATLRDLGGASFERQCVLCRERRPKLALVQGIVAGKGSRRHGYVCIRRACLAAALPDTGALLAEATRRLAQLVGLARRLGQAALGAGALERESRAANAVVLVASDAAERTIRAIGPEGLPVPLSSEQLGHAAGHRPVAAVMLRPGRHAAQAAYWQRVWYEARDTETRLAQ